MKKNISYLKRKLLKKIPIHDESYFQKLPLKHAILLSVFAISPSDENYVRYILQTLRDERNKLSQDGIFQDRWPKQLLGEDWEVRLQNKFGVKLPPPKEVGSHAIQQEKKQDSISVVKQDQSSLQSSGVEEKPSKPVNQGDPFRSDGYGTLLEDWNKKSENGIVPLVNKVRIP